MKSSEAQNPYNSYIVEASAGSGKTYQLSRRFLHLIASGANPTQILALTFTVKAAKEMRARIIEEASSLLMDEKKQKELEASIEKFYFFAQKERGEFRIRPPLKAKEVAKKILASTQSLKVTTIDSIFSEWVRKFPWEASGCDTNEQLPAFFKLLDSKEKEEIDVLAWELMFAETSLRDLVLEIWQKLKGIEIGRGILGIEDRILELFKYATFLWTASFAEENSTFLKHSNACQKFTNIEEMLAHIKDHLIDIVSETAREEQFLEAIAKADFKALCELRLFTKVGEISGATIKGKRREFLGEKIAEVDRICRSYFDQEKIENLNQLGALFYNVYQSWQKERDLLKFAKNSLEFQDLAKGSFRLFENPRGTGAVWLLQKGIEHLLIDEFQDTSFLQWSVFAKLTTEMLSGLGTNDLSTVFIVGDPKQSIYGFREADPEVLHLAKQVFANFSKKILPLSVSYRQAPLLLQYINQVFPPLFGEAFAPHLPATKHNENGEELLVPGCSKIAILSLAKKQGSEAHDYTSVENEARALATYLHKAFNEKKSHPVFRKIGNTTNYSALQPKDCCILYRSSVHVAIYERELHKLGIATRKEEQRGFFVRPEIEDALALLRFLAHPSDTVSLLSFLKSPFIAMRDSSMLSALIKLTETEATPNPNNLLLLLSQDIAEVMKKLQIAASSMLPHEILWQAVKRLGACQSYELAFGAREGKLAYKNLLRLIEISASLEDQGYASLSKISERFTVLQEADEHGSAVMDSNVVTLMTIHKAKGLEYPLVAVVGTANAWYKQDRYWLKNTNPDPGVYFMGIKEQQPNFCTNFKDLVKKGEKSMQEESKRLLYVALSRASQYLVISGHEGHEKNSESFYPALLQAAKNFTTCEDLGESGIQIIDRFILSLQDEIKQDKEPTKIEFIRSTPQAEMLSQCEIIKPHTEITMPDQTELTPEHAIISSFLGIFIHRILEFNSLKKDIGDMWNLFTKIVLKKSAGRIQQNEKWWKDIFKQTLKQISETLEHPTWIKWHKDALEIKAEANILHHEQGKLMRGQIDLFLRFKDEIILIDYKSSAKKFAFQDTLSLQEYCYASGYAKQLRYYQKALHKLYPKHRIRSFVWFTQGAVAVELTQVENSNKSKEDFYENLPAQFSQESSSLPEL